MCHFTAVRALGILFSSCVATDRPMEGRNGDFNVEILIVGEHGVSCNVCGISQNEVITLFDSLERAVNGPACECVCAISTQTRHSEPRSATTHPTYATDMSVLKIPQNH
ncbi:unnamed protein product [Ectocarpus fasciculatus]